MPAYRRAAVVAEWRHGEIKADFVGGDDDCSRYVLTWVVHNVSDLKRKDVEYVFKLQPKDSEIERNYARIKALRKHESVVRVSNDDLIAIRDKAFWELYNEITNSGEE